MTAARILLVEVNEDGTAGGSHQCLFDIARSLDPARFTPVVLFYQHNRFVDQLARLGIRTLVWEPERARERPVEAPLRRLKQLIRLRQVIARRMRLLRSERIDLVHMNNAPVIGYADWLPAAKLLGIPILSHARLQFRRPRAVWFPLVRSFDAVVAISHEIERFLHEHDIPPERIIQIYDGIDAAALRASAGSAPAKVREQLGVADGDLLIAMVGHVRRWKGQLVALEAVRRLQPSIRRRVKLVFVGGVGREEEAYAAELRERLATYELQTTVTLLGERDDAPAIMQAADIVLHASIRPEPFGLVVVEGMALGRAVVAAGFGGPAEIVTPGTGVLFNPAHPEELTSAIESLALDPARRQALGAAAQQRAAAFSLEQNVQAVETLYSSLLTRSRPSAAR